MNIRTENWLGHEIRFVEKEGEWRAVLADISKALGLSAREVKRRIPSDVVSTHMVESGNGLRKMLTVNEYGIYETVFESRKKEAKEFKRWVFEMLKTLRQSTGLEGFQVFRMLDKEHQKEAMANLHRSLREPKQVNFIKANTITNKAVSSKYGYSKMVKKGDMSPEMLVDREPILDDTVELIGVADRFNLPIKVSEAIYSKYVQ